MAVSVAVVTAVSVATLGRQRSSDPPETVSSIGETSDQGRRTEVGRLGQDAGGQDPGVAVELGADRHPEAG